VDQRATVRSNEVVFLVETYSAVCIRYNPLQPVVVKTTSVLFFVAASHSLHWAICAPAAASSHGCHFSGTLSGIEPQPPVTRQRQGSPLHYLQYLIGGKFVQRRTELCFRDFGLRQQLQLLCSSVYFCFGQSHRPPHVQVAPWCLIASDCSYRY